MKQIRVVIIDPRQLIRECFEQFLRGPLFSVVAAGTTLADAFSSSAGMDQVDVVVLCHSTEAEVEAQLATLRHLSDGPRRPRFVLVTEIEEPDLLRRALASGVDALLSKDISGRVLQRSLELVALGQRLFPVSLVQGTPTLLRYVLPRPVASDLAMPGGDAEPKRTPALTAVATPSASTMPQFGAQPPFAPPEAALPGLQGRNALSKRENQVLGYLVRAFPNREIARELQITEATVKVHVKALLRKVCASNRTQAAIWALSNCTAFSQAADEGATSPRPT